MYFQALFALLLVRTGETSGSFTNAVQIFNSCKCARRCARRYRINYQHYENKLPEFGFALWMYCETHFPPSLLNVRHITYLTAFVLHFPLFFSRLPSIHPSNGRSFCFPASFSQSEWGAVKQQSEAPLEMEGGLKEVLDISPLRDRNHAHIRGHIRAEKTYMCTHTQLQISAFDTFRVLPTPHLFTLLIHSLPYCLSISLFLAMHTVQKLYFWLTRLEHKRLFLCILEKPH